MSSWHLSQWGAMILNHINKGFTCQNNCCLLLVLIVSDEMWKYNLAGVMAQLLKASCYGPVPCQFWSHLYSKFGCHIDFPSSFSFPPGRKGIWYFMIHFWVLVIFVSLFKPTWHPKRKDTETATSSLSEIFNVFLIRFQVTSAEQNFGPRISVSIGYLNKTCINIPWGVVDQLLRLPHQKLQEVKV